MLGCSRCGKSDEGLNITLYKGVPYCDDCFAIVLPPANVMCSFRCGRTVTEPNELTKRQPLCNECKIKMNSDVVKMTTEIDKAKAIDASVELKQDIFNAATMSIIALKAEIDANVEIENKPYFLAETLRARHEKWREVVFDLNQKLADAGTEQRAIQVYLNNMANTLRAEEREKLRISDINYKPQNVQPVKVKSIKTGESKKKASKKDISEAAKQLGINEFTLHAFVLSRNGDLAAAVKALKQNLEAAKSQSN